MMHGARAAEARRGLLDLRPLRTSATEQLNFIAT